MSFHVPEGHYLVCYDYGTGGVWWFIRANSPEEIRSASSDLIVFDKAPSWMLKERWDKIETDELNRPKSEALKLILAGQ